MWGMWRLWLQSNTLAPRDSRSREHMSTLPVQDILAEFAIRSLRLKWVLTQSPLGEYKAICHRVDLRTSAFQGISEWDAFTEVHISDLERGAREVGLRHLAALATAFEMSLSEFLKGVKGS